MVANSPQHRIPWDLFWITLAAFACRAALWSLAVAERLAACRGALLFDGAKAQVLVNKELHLEFGTGGPPTPACFQGFHEAFQIGIEAELA